MFVCRLKPVSGQAGLFSISWRLHFSNKCAQGYSDGHIHNRHFYSSCHSSIQPKAGGWGGAVFTVCPLWTPLWLQLNRSSHWSDDFSHWQVSTILSLGCQLHNSKGNKRECTTHLWPPVSLSTKPVQQSVLNLEIWQVVIQLGMLHLHEPNQQLGRQDRDLD